MAALLWQYSSSTGEAHNGTFRLPDWVKPDLHWKTRDDKKQDISLTKKTTQQMSGFVITNYIYNDIVQIMDVKQLPKNDSGIV